MTRLNESGLAIELAAILTRHQEGTPKAGHKASAGFVSVLRQLLSVLRKNSSGNPYHDPANTNEDETLTRAKVAHKPYDAAIVLGDYFEGLSLTPYLCPAQVPTIGKGSTFYEDGTRVTLADPPITKERANKLVMHTLETIFMPALDRLSPRLRQECQLTGNYNRYGAILDFMFNVGVNAYKSSTLRKKINKGLWDEVDYQLSRWIYARKVALNGLRRRRKAESVVFYKLDPVFLGFDVEAVVRS